MSLFLRRCMTSPMAARVATPRAAAMLPRTYASTTKGGDTTNATNLATPSPKPSDSAVEGDIKSSRATERQPQEQGGSTAQPISKENQSMTGQDEAGQDPMKELGKDLEKEGSKPLDAADK